MQKEIRDGLRNEGENSLDITVKSLCPTDGNSAGGDYLECDSLSGNLPCRERVSHRQEITKAIFLQCIFLFFIMCLYKVHQTD